MGYTGGGSGSYADTAGGGGGGDYGAYRGGGGGNYGVAGGRGTGNYGSYRDAGGGDTTGPDTTGPDATGPDSAASQVGAPDQSVSLGGAGADQSPIGGAGAGADVGAGQSFDLGGAGVGGQAAQGVNYVDAGGFGQSTDQLGLQADPNAQIGQQPSTDQLGIGYTAADSAGAATVAATGGATGAGITAAAPTTAAAGGGGVGIGVPASTGDILAASSGDVLGQQDDTLLQAGAAGTSPTGTAADTAAQYGVTGPGAMDYLQSGGGSTAQPMETQDGGQTLTDPYGPDPITGLPNLLGPPEAFDYPGGQPAPEYAELGQPDVPLNAPQDTIMEAANRPVPNYPVPKVDRPPGTPVSGPGVTNNPGAMWPSTNPNAPVNVQGSTGWVQLTDAAQNRIGVFPDTAQGAAAQFGLLDSSAYLGKTIQQVAQNWTGNTGGQQTVTTYADALARAMTDADPNNPVTRNTVLTDDMVRGPAGLALAQQQSINEGATGATAYPNYSFGAGQAMAFNDPNASWLAGQPSRMGDVLNEANLSSGTPGINTATTTPGLTDGAGAVPQQTSPIGLGGLNYGLSGAGLSDAELGLPDTSGAPPDAGFAFGQPQGQQDTGQPGAVTRGLTFEEAQERYGWTEQQYNDYMKSIEQIRPEGTAWRPSTVSGPQTGTPGPDLLNPQPNVSDPIGIESTRPTPLAEPQVYGPDPITGLPNLLGPPAWTDPAQVPGPTFPGSISGIPGTETLPAAADTPWVNPPTTVGTTGVFNPPTPGPDVFNAPMQGVPIGPPDQLYNQPYKGVPIGAPTAIAPPDTAPDVYNAPMKGVPIGTTGIPLTTPGPTGTPPAPPVIAAPPEVAPPAPPDEPVPPNVLPTPQPLSPAPPPFNPPPFTPSPTPQAGPPAGWPPEDVPGWAPSQAPPTGAGPAAAPPAAVAGAPSGHDPTGGFERGPPPYAPVPQQGGLPPAPQVVNAMLQNASPAVQQAANGLTPQQQTAVSQYAFGLINQARQLLENEGGIADPSSAQWQQQILPNIQQQTQQYVLQLTGRQNPQAVQQILAAA